MSIQTRRIQHSLSILAAGILACTFSASPPAPVDDKPASPQEATPTAAAEISVPPGSPPAGMLEINGLDPCTLVTRESAEMALGQAVDEPIAAQTDTISSCTYVAVPGEKMVMVTVWKGEDAKNYLIDEAAQLQDGCNLKFTASTNPEQPTPFPPELEALKDESILELLRRDLGVQESCGGSYTQLIELGDNAYSFQSIFVGAVIGVAIDDALIVFVVGDIGVPPEEALSAAKNLVKGAAAK